VSGVSAGHRRNTSADPLGPIPTERGCQFRRGSDWVSTSTRSAPAPVLTVRLASMPST
jgi:hypothetical protein